MWVIDMATVVGGEPVAAALVFNREDHTGAALRPSITTDGLLATAGADGLVRIWDLRSDRLIVEFRSEFDDQVVVFSPDSSYLLYPYRGNIARFYLDLDRLVTLAESRLTRDFTLDECRLYREPETCTTSEGA